MLTIHRLTAGNGYKYLLKHVATGDVDRRMTSPLTAYYAASGYPAGRWLGNGLPGLGDGALQAGTEVTEAQLAALFGRGEDPLNGRLLGKAYPAYKSPSQRINEQIAALPSILSDSDRATAIEHIRQTEARRRTQHPVAGFDLTFSPVKSVSALWAIADTGTQEQIVRAHHDTINDVLDLIQRHAAFSRTGEKGVAQIDTRGVIAAAFDHWDTRSGDPQLHTHLVIANRVQGTDGRWRTLDGRVLYQSCVAMSEIHNVLLADRLTERLGVDWEHRNRGVRRNPAFEITGVPDELLREFSARTTQIEDNLAELLAQREPGTPDPTRRGMYVLRQQATLMNRPAKHLVKPLSEMVAGWRQRARDNVGLDPATVVAAAVQESSRRPLHAGDLADDTITAYASTVVLALQARRSTWTRWNILAETARQSRTLRMATANDRLALLDTIADQVEAQSISLSAPSFVQRTERLARLDGESVFTMHHGRIFTSAMVLGAEALLLDLTNDHTGPAVPARAVRSAVHKAELGDSQRQALERIAASGQKVEALVGPAGTGKTSVLAILRDAWESQYGPGTVVAVAPSSAAAEVLSDALDVPSDNIAKWIHESIGLGAAQRADWIARAEQALRTTSHHPRTKKRQLQLLAQLAEARSDQDRWRLRPSQLLIVDEASMAGTADLAALARQAADAGAKLLLVGDDAQLGAVDAGGAFRLIVKDTHAARLTEVWRFDNEWERQASLGLRQGNARALDAYEDHGRIVAGSSDDMERAAYRAWLKDTEVGLASLLVAADNQTVTRLNARARLDRVAAGQVESEGVLLHDGNEAGVGDVVVTRLNSRHIRSETGDSVRNGDTWDVVRRWDDGSLTVHNVDSGTLTLSAAYVAESVELAYATTAHRAQGSTVDTAHLLVTERLSRELMYVGMTRARTHNQAYVVTTDTTQELHEPRTEQTQRDILEGVLERVDLEPSAHEVMRQELDNAVRLDRLIPIHDHLCQVAMAERVQAALATTSLPAIDHAQILASPAYGPLVAALRRAEHHGLDLAITLQKATRQGSLNRAKDLAAVLHAHVERLVQRAQ
ncbi:MobF family relaxase [Kribbella deserti]